MRYLVAVAVFFISSYCTAQTTWIVPDDFPAGIQAAIENSSVMDGDTIVVRPGTYYEVVDFLGKGVTLISEQGPEKTVVDGMQKPWGVFMFREFEGPDSVLNGFTVTNSQGHLGSQGSVYCCNSGPTIINNIITDNDSVGINLTESSAMISNNIIQYNTSDQSGGGILCYKSNAHISNNLIHHNEANINMAGYGMGGGIYCMEDNSLIRSNTIQKNFAIRGGGICFNEPCSTLVITNIISSNSASFGGAFLTNSSAGTIINCTLFGNEASQGGAIFLIDQSEMEIINTILWNNNADLGKEIYISDNYDPSKLSIDYSDIDEGIDSIYLEPQAVLEWGDHMISNDPLFVDPFKHDFHLCFASPCKDQGYNQTSPEFDYEGDPRSAYGFSDMGADEFYTHVYYAGKATPGMTVTLHIVDTPSKYPVFLWIGTGILDTPINTLYGAWHLLTPSLFVFLPGTIPSPDGIYFISDTIPLGFPAPMDIYIQAFVESKLTNMCTISIVE